MQHTKCGLAGVSDAELRALTGADLEFFPIDDHAAALREDVELLARTPHLSRLRMIAGFIYDVESGRGRGRRPLGATGLRSVPR